MDDDLESSIHESPRGPSPVSKRRRSTKSSKGTVRSASAQGRRSSKPPSSASSIQQLQTEMMLRTYRGRTDSFTGLDPKQKLNAPYASTSHFLRQTVGIEREKTSDLPTSRVSARTPHYKTQEEYYDIVIALKKQIQELNNDNSMYKLKLRRVEEDYIKKKREVEQLLDPVKNDQVRRTLAESKPESGMVVHGLKQKILKLEEQVREKEAAYSKLQSDLKTTKFEETKLALEVCYNEIQRLRHEKASATTSSPRKQSVPKENVSKLKLLTAQLMKSNIERSRLIQDNKSLKEKLDRCMESKPEKSNSRTRKEYEDMSKGELLAVIARLEKKLNRSDSVNGDADKPLQIDEGKVPLQGTGKERLDQLDKRETELLKKVDQQTNTIKKLKEDIAYYRTKCNEKDTEIKTLKKEIDSLQKELDKGSKRSRTPEPSLRSGSGDVHSPSSKTESRPTSARRNSAEDHRDRLRKSEELRRNIAARRIQAGWRQHQARDEDDSDENVEMLQSALRGHLARQKNVAHLRRGVDRRPSGSSYSQSVNNDSDLDEAAEMLQSNLRAHTYRKQMLSRRVSSSQRGSRPSSRASSRGGSDEELGGTRTPVKSGPSGHGRQSPQGRGRITTSRILDANSDSEDEIVVSKGGKTKNSKLF